MKQRKDGRWEAKLPLPDGKRKTIYGRTKKELQANLYQARKAVEEGRLLGQPSQKVQTYLEHWLEDQKRHTVRATTYESYRLNVQRVLPYLGQYKLESLTASHIQHCYTHLKKERELSDYSVQQVHRVLRAALKHAQKLGLIGRNPIDLVKPPRTEKRAIHPLKPEEVQSLLRATDDPLYSLWALLVTTGLRIGEATGLRWADVDLDAGTAHIHQSIHWQSGKGMVAGPPKTNRSARPVHLPSGVVAALRAHRTEEKRKALETGRPWSTDDLVFTTRNGGPLTPSYLRSCFRRSAARLGITVVRLHDLRHTAATYLLSQGTHPKVVQEMLGHSTISQTLDTYSHYVPTLHKDAVHLMDRLFTA